MSVRVSRTSVTFAHSFTLSSISGVQPSGTYRLDIEESDVDGRSFQASDRLIAHLHLPSNRGAGDGDQVVHVDATELADALAADSD